jgi:hypothetical protein
MAAYRWRQLAAAWSIALALGVLTAGSFALSPGVDTAQAAPAWRGVDRQYNPQRLDRFSPDAIEMDD